MSNHTITMKPLTYRPTWAEINLKNLDYNFKLVKKLAGREVKILVPVKADGYGHGIVAVSKRLERLGVDYLGIASIDEGITLRNAGIKTPLLVLSTVLPADAKPVIAYNLTQTICTKELAMALSLEAVKKNKAVKVHVKIDTGMHRIGVAYGSAYAFIKEIGKLKNLIIEGIFTHFPCADTKSGFTKGQIKEFDDLIDTLEGEGNVITLKHAQNSLGVIGYPKGLCTMVRPGLMLYGLYPKQRLKIKLKPLLSLKTKIVCIKTIDKGKGVSYGHSYISGRAMKVATLPIGYGDGYPRALSNKAYCLVNGKKAKIIGRICMDQTMIDITKIEGVSVGQEVVLIGKQKGENVTAEQLARLADTIPYEIICNLGGRIRWV